MTHHSEADRDEVRDQIAHAMSGFTGYFNDDLDAVMAIVDPIVAEREQFRAELEFFVEASLEECDYTSDGESGGWEPDDYERAKSNIAEMHRLLLVRLERLFQTQDREAAERESRFRWAEEAAQVASERAALWALCKIITRSRMAERCKGCYEDAAALVDTAARLRESESERGRLEAELERAMSAIVNVYGKPGPSTLAETRTGSDWCPNCCQEAGTNRYRDDAGVERCATCGSELAEREEPADVQ